MYNPCSGGGGGERREERGRRPPPPPPPLPFGGGGRPRGNAAVAAATDRGAIGRRGSGIEMAEGKAAAADDDDGGLGDPVIYIFESTADIGYAVPSYRTCHIILRNLN